MTEGGAARRAGAWIERRPSRGAVAAPGRFPPLDLTRLRPRPLEARLPGRLGRVVPARPLARRGDGDADDRRILPWWAGSGVVHALLLFAILYNLTPRGAPSSPEPPTVEMVFGHAGSSGLQGVSVPKEEQGANTTPTHQPTPEKQELEPPAPLLEAPPAPPLPALPALPSPQPAPPQEALRDTHSERPSRSAHQPTRSTNPFANMTDLSFAPTPRFERLGRGGSGSAINLSLGPMVQGGRLAMPFSMHGGHGVSADYQEMIDEWVEAHKYYPEGAARRGHDGNVAIHVVWDRDGHVLDVQLESGSGDPDLDDAWTGLFRGAHLPPPPPDVKGDPISMDMTMHFILTH